MTRSWKLVGFETPEGPSELRVGDLEALKTCPGPIYVICVNGKGRVGKSTFLNLLVAEALGEEHAAAFSMWASTPPR
jgi:predicted AAA+ superfamily ATPase